MNIAVNLIDYLQGKWQLRRSITGHGTVTGQANFQILPNESTTLYYQEKGVWITNADRHLNCYREYFYCFDNNQINVFFANEGLRSDLFYCLNFDLKDCKDFIRTTAVHYCKNDCYQAEYLFLDNHHFKLTYAVTGPGKNYRSETIFFRERRNVRERVDCGIEP